MKAIFENIGREKQPIWPDIMLVVYKRELGLHSPLSSLSLSLS